MNFRGHFFLFFFPGAPSINLADVLLRALMSLLFSNAEIFWIAFFTSVWWRAPSLRQISVSLPPYDPPFFLWCNRL